MSIERGSYKSTGPETRGTAEGEGATFTPTLELLEQLRGSLQLAGDVSEGDIANAYLLSLAQSKGEFAVNGTPVDSLPVGINSAEVEEWAKRTTGR